MKIETKFKPGDEVFYVEGSKLKKHIIHSLRIELGVEGNIIINYYFKILTFNGEDYTYIIKDESLVFASMDEFLNQIFK